MHRTLFKFLKTHISGAESKKAFAVPNLAGLNLLIMYISALYFVINLNEVYTKSIYIKAFLVVCQTKRPPSSKSETVFERFAKLQLPYATQNDCYQPMVDLCLHSIRFGKVPQESTIA
jgi:hypothetical protein